MVGLVNKRERSLIGLYEYSVVAYYFIWELWGGSELVSLHVRWPYLTTVCLSYNDLLVKTHFSTIFVQPQI